MSSFLRRLQRRLHKSKRGNRPNAIRNVTEAGYEICHFTKGWKRYSAKRARLLTSIDPMPKAT